MSTADTLGSLEQALTAIEQYRAANSPVSGDLDLHLALLRLVADREARMRPPELTAPPLADQPLLRSFALEVDWNEAVALAGTVLEVLRQHRPDLIEYLGPVSALISQAESFAAVATPFLDGHTLPLPEARATMALESGALLQFVVLYALRPTLRAYAAALASVDFEKWQRGTCPVCGGLPDFAALVQKPEGGRVLLCSRCDTEWTFPRVACPFCGNVDSAQQGYYPVGEDQVYRLYTCEHCHSYLKTVDARAAAHPLPLTAERVLTIELDGEAARSGYRSPLAPL